MLEQATQCCILTPCVKLDAIRLQETTVNLRPIYGEKSHPVLSFSRVLSAFSRWDRGWRFSWFFSAVDQRCKYNSQQWDKHTCMVSGW